MSFVWDEPEYLQQARELAMQFNKNYDISGIQKAMSSFQSALKGAVPSTSMESITTAVKAIQFAMPAINKQSISGQQMTLKSALQISEALQSASAALRPLYEMKNSLQGLFGNQSLMEALQESSTWQRNITGILETVTPLLPKIDVQVFAKPLLENNKTFTSFLEKYAQDFDFDCLNIQDGALVYDGHEYSIGDLQQEFNDEIAAIENKQSLRERFEKNNTLFVIGILIYLFLLFPQIDKVVPWYSEKYEALQAFVQSVSATMQQGLYVFTIKDITYLRMEPNVKSKILANIVYHTRLRVISTETSRWLKVEYTDEQGIVVIGWVSRVSVEMEKG